LESSRVAPWEGLMRRSRLAAGLLLVAALLAAGLLLPNCGRRKTAEAEPLLCYVGGTMRAAMEELARLYRHRTGREVVMDCAGSGELLIRMRATRKGDLYVCHDPFLGALRRMRLCGEAWAVASLTSVIAVAKGNPKGVRGLKDLARPDLRVGLTDAEYSTAGRIVALMLRRADLEEAVTRNVKTRTRQGGELANAIALGSLDAGIVWNAVAHLRREKLDAVPIEAEWLPRRGVDAVTSASFRSMEMDDVRVTIATLTCSRWPEETRRFADFVASPEGQCVFARHGFTPVDGGRPEKDVNLPPLKGSILIHCGAGMRRPIAELAREFADRTGVQVKANYAGSNVLLGQIELSRTGDVYIPGDADYVEMARKKGLVTFHRPLCYFVPVIMVAKGNPLGIRSLADLARPGVRVAWETRGRRPSAGSPKESCAGAASLVRR